MKINKTSIFILLSSLCLTLAGCGGGDDDYFDDSSSGNTTPASTPTTNTPTTPSSSDEDAGTKGETLTVDARPTDWVRVNTDINPMVSLSLTIARPDLSQYAAPADSGSWKDDLMATFVNGTCRGVSEPFQDGTIEGSTKENIIFMPVVAGLTSDNVDATKTVTIKYYSARLRHIFTATSPYPLKNDVEAYGTRTNPLSLTWSK